MIRSKWKLPYVDLATERHVRYWQIRFGNVRNKTPALWTSRSRDTTITKPLLNHPIRLYNGKTHFIITVQKIHLGVKLGALVLTKTIGSYVHKNNRIILKKKKAASILRQRKVKKKKSKLKQSQKKKNLKKIK